MAIRIFPSDLNKLAWSSKKTMAWNTEVQTSGSGMVRTMTNRLYPSWTIQTKFAFLSNLEYQKFLGFVALVKGAHEPFLWLDPDDYEIKGLRLTANADGKTYQALLKMGEYVEPVEYIDRVTVYINGITAPATSYKVQDGQIIFNTAPGRDAKVTADYRYYWKVMFKDDKVTIENVYTNINKSDTFKLEVVR